MKLNPAQQLIAEFGILMENREAVVAVADGSRFPFAAALKGISLGDKRPKEDTYRDCAICGGHHTPPHAWEPRTEK